MQLFHFNYNIILRVLIKLKKIGSFNLISPVNLTPMVVILKKKKVAAQGRENARLN